MIHNRGPINETLKWIPLHKQKPKRGLWVLLRIESCVDVFVPHGMFQRDRSGWKTIWGERLQTAWNRGVTHWAAMPKGKP